MVVSRALTSSVAEAISSTFDGQHPCAMCSAISEGRCNEQDAGANFAPLKKSAEVKFLKLVSDVVPARSDGEGTAVWPGFAPHGVVRVGPPLTPPPIA